MNVPRGHLQDGSGFILFPGWGPSVYTVVLIAEIFSVGAGPNLVFVRWALQSAGSSDSPRPAATGLLGRLDEPPVSAISGPAAAAAGPTNAARARAAPARHMPVSLSVSVSREAVPMPMFRVNCSETVPSLVPHPRTFSKTSANTHQSPTS